jgi:hypothetical protein
VLAMAEAWGIPPWEIEERGSALWGERYVLWRTAVNKAQEKAQKDPGRGATRGRDLLG